MDTRIHAVRRVALTLLLWAVASAATAGLAQFDWTSRAGHGVIVYDRDVPDSDPTFRRGLFLDNIVSYDVFGWDADMNPRRFTGTGGSIFMRSWPSTDCPATFDCAFEEHMLFFQLGTPEPGEPGLWQVNFNMSPATGDPDSPMPFFEQFGDTHGYISNPSVARTYSTLDLANRVTHQPLATPVPEPGTLALAALGLVAVVAGTRRAARGETGGAR